MDSGMTFAIKLVIGSTGHFEIFAFVQNDDGVIPALACENGDPEGL
jgi:hypothetical protein